MAHGATSRKNRAARRATLKGATTKPPAAIVAAADAFRRDAHARELEELAARARGAAPAAPTRESILAALTAAGLNDSPSGGVQATYELATERSIAELRFDEAVLAASFAEMSSASWPCEADLEDVGETIFRDGNCGVYRLPDGTIAHLHIGRGWLNVRMAAAKRSALAEAHAAFSIAYPPLYRQSEENEGSVPITFWSDSTWGPVSRLRMIDAASWSEIAENYAGAVSGELARLMSDEFAPGRDGQLLLWQGPPGTGKTWALRALASEWRDWAEFHYITDPDAFFVTNPSYMIDVLLADTYQELEIDPDGDVDVVTSVREGGKWRVLILEDTGELLSANAKEAYGQGLSRLLNVVDGMVGQGLRVLALVTTNDELGELHPAVVRPGRCASQLEFSPLSKDEADVWIGRQNLPAGGVVAADGEMTLAELYARVGLAPAAAFATGECTCGHMADDHGSDGAACTAEGCDCAEYEAAGEASSDAVTADASIITNAYGDKLAKTIHLSLARADGTPIPQEEISERLRLAFSDLQLVEVPQTEIPPRAASPTAPETQVTARASMKRWTATLAPEGIPTDDGRMFADGSISWRELPLTLMAQLETADGHDGAHVAGRIDEIWREGSTIKASGVFDDSEFGQEIARMVADGVLRGVSVDIAIRKWEIAYRSDLEGGDVPADDGGEPDLVDMLYEASDLLFLVTDGVIGAVTVCSFPAFADATIALAASLVASIQSPALWTYTSQAGWVVTADLDEALIAAAPPATVGVPVEGTVEWMDGEPGEAIQEGPPGVEPIHAAPAALIAATIPTAPPAGWFHNPEFEALTALVVEEGGRVYGHLAAWDTCHLSFEICTVAPHSNTDYSYFQLGEVYCDNGDAFATGKITLGTGHADTGLGWRAAIEHYDHTGTVVADVCAGEDEFGIWIAGALRPSLTDETVRELRAAPLSGDWRNINGNLELVAALAVNVPGFPVPRVRALVASSEDGDRVMALVAAGAHDGTRIITGFSVDALREIAALAAVASGEWASELDELAARARRTG